MAWNYRLDVSDHWRAVKNDAMDLSEFLPILVERLDQLLQQVGILDGIWLKEIRDRFDTLAVDTFPDVDDFDQIWNEFYNWADLARCWVATR